MSEFGAGGSNCTGYLSDNTFEGNIALSNGGGIYRCDAIIEDNIISYNTALKSGAGIGNCDGLIQRNTVSYNSAYSGGGGGVYDCTSTLLNNAIFNNQATYGGGIMQCDSNINNNIIVANSAEIGGGIYKCDHIISNNVIFGNTAENNGGGMSECNAIIQNCILWNNVALSNPQLDDTSIPSFSCIQDWSGGGTGNISIDPLFIDPTGNNFKLQETSPCIDTGNPDSLFNDDFIPPGKNSLRNDMGTYGGAFNGGWKETLALPSHFDFLDYSQGWSFVSTPDTFDPAKPGIETDRLSLSPMGSTTCFSSWLSPEMAIEDDTVYLARWTVGSSQTDANKTVQFRLRVNQKGSWQAWENTVSSYLSRAPSYAQSKQYDILFHPRVQGSEDDTIQCAFDLLSFSWDDDLYSSVRLDELEVEEVTMTPGATVAEFDFATDSDGWTFTGTIPPFDTAITSVEPGHIGISANGSTNCFGYWESPGVTIEDGNYYRTRFTVGTSVTDPDNAIQCRLRTTQQGSFHSWSRTVNSNLQNSPSATQSRTYSVVSSPVVVGSSDNTFTLTYDIASFDSSDDTTSWLYLENAIIEEVTISE